MKLSLIYEMTTQQAIAILGIKPRSSLGDIKKAHRKAVLKFHPDRPNGDVEKFKLAQSAVEILTGKRKSTFDTPPNNTPPPMPPNNTPPPMPPNNTPPPMPPNNTPPPMPPNNTPPPMPPNNTPPPFDHHKQFWQDMRNLQAKTNAKMYPK